MKRLLKQTEAFSWSYDIPSNPNLWTLRDTGGDWEVENNTSNQISCISLNQYIDLAGMSQREKTLFIKGLGVQNQIAPSATDALPGDQIENIIIVSDVPADRFSFFGPGFSGSKMSSENCGLFLQQIWSWTQDSASWGSYPILQSEVSHGMMTATASDRLYVSVLSRLKTRKTSSTGQPVSTIDNVVVGGIRVVVDVEAKDEAEYQYLMRLRRSYELQQSHDED